MSVVVHFKQIQNIIKCIFFNKANSYFTYRSFKSKIQNVEFQFGSTVTIHTCPADAWARQPRPGHTKDTHDTHTRTHMRFGELLCQAQHLELPVFRARWYWEHSTYQETTHKQLHTVSQPMEMQLQNVLRKTDWKGTISDVNVNCTGASRTDLWPEWGLGEALLKQEYFNIIELEIRSTVNTLLKETEHYLTSQTATNNFNRD